MYCHCGINLVVIWVFNAVYDTFASQNATSSISIATSNSTMRSAASAYSGIVCRSPVPRSPMTRPPLSANKVGPKNVDKMQPQSTHKAPSVLVGNCSSCASRLIILALGARRHRSQPHTAITMAHLLLRHQIWRCPVGTF